MSRGPVLTLAAVVVLGLVLLGANVLLQPAAPAASGAGQGGPPPTASPDIKFVGYATMSQGQVPVAVTVEDGRATMYVCDGTSTDAWLQGSAPAGGTPQGRLDVNGHRGDHATGTFSGTSLAGSVHLAGQGDASFTASSTKDARAGIYRSARAGKVSGWVVLGDESDNATTSDTTDAAKGTTSGSSGTGNDKNGDGENKNDNKNDGKNDNGKNDNGKNDNGKNDNGNGKNDDDNAKNKNDGDGNKNSSKNGSKKNTQVGVTRDSGGATSPAAPLPLDGGPWPPGVSMVDADTDVLTGW